MAEAEYVNSESNKNEPGSAKHGNFINYYQFHPPSERISVFPFNLWKEIISCKSNDQTKFFGIDIGCNTGELTKAIFNYLNTNIPSNLELNLLGLDLDPVLIERATCDNLDTHINYKVCDFMNENDYSKVLEVYLTHENVKKFDIGFCFSVTMWIHLNHGDEGLKTFLLRMSKISNCILIEPQPWKCYLSAARRMRRLKQKDLTNLDHLTIRNNVIDFIIEFLTNTCNMIKVYESDNTKWGRKLFLLRSKPLN